jgi:hypothetical protein
LEQAAIKRNVIIASGEESTGNIEQSSTLQANAKTGVGTIPAGQTSITINNNHVAAGSQIIVSAEDNRQNKVLFVSARKVGSPSTGSGLGWFKVDLDSPGNQDTKFNWWIID